MNLLKTSLVFLFILTLISYSVCDSIDPNYSYDDFMRHFNRTYTGAEKAMHEEIFKQNYDELIRKINNGEDVKVNNFLDWTQEQLDAFFNYRPGSLGRPLTPRPLQSSLYLSPSSFDWRSQARVTPIKDQQFCGSCWAFASTAQYESLLAIQTNGTIYDLSQQYAIECEKVSSNGCNGGYPLSALQLYNRTGIPLETTYPYQPSEAGYYTTRGKAICTDSNRIKLAVSTTTILHYSNLTTEQIQDQLVKSGPLTVAVYASHSAFQYVGSSGLINNCPTDGGPDHAVLLVGYNSSHWFIKNSWGPLWGHNGYAYILKTNDCKLSTWVDVMKIQSGSTPTPTPSSQGYISFNITMTDSKGDGWNGNILAFRQDGVIVATFGTGFTTGKNYGPQSVRIKNNVQTDILVAQKGNYTNQIGFTIKNEQGTTVYSRVNGTTFEANTIFKNFCPTASCPTATTVDYTIALTDSYGDGWNGVVLAFRQNGKLQNFGDKFTSGAEYPVTVYTFEKLKAVDIIVSIPGQWTEEIGFIVRNRQGYVVMQRVSGQAFEANAILGSFCPECVNYSPVRVVGDQQIREQDIKPIKPSTADQPLVKQTNNQDQSYSTQRLEQLQEQNYKVMRGLMITTIVLASCVLLLLISLAVVMLRNQRISQVNEKHTNFLTSRTAANITSSPEQSPNTGSVISRENNGIYLQPPVSKNYLR